MNTLKSRPQPFSRIAALCLAASALLPMTAHAGGHGTGRANAVQPTATQEFDRLKQQLLGLESRIAQLENKTVKEVATDGAVVGPKEESRQARLPQVAKGN